MVQITPDFTGQTVITTFGMSPGTAPACLGLRCRYPISSAAPRPS